MEFRKRLWLNCIYLSLVRKLFSLCLCPVFTTSLQRIGVELLYVLEALYIQVAVGSIDPFGLLRITRKNCTNFLSNFFVTYLGCVITKINKSQKISACHVKYVLFILEKQNGSVNPFRSSRVNILLKVKYRFLNSSNAINNYTFLSLIDCTNFIKSYFHKHFIIYFCVVLAYIIGCFIISPFLKLKMLGFSSDRI